MDMHLEKILENCKDLAYLNKYANYLRETEYRILLIVCGHTRHKFISIHSVCDYLKEYFDVYENKTHVKNITYLLNVALKKVFAAQTYELLNVSRETLANA